MMIDVGRIFAREEYEQGFRHGLEESIQRNMQRARKLGLELGREALLETAVKPLAAGSALERVAEITGLAIDDVRLVRGPLQ